MAQTTPPTLTPPGTAPDPNDRGTFDSRAYALTTWFSTMVSEMTAAMANVYNNAVDAFNSATAAASSASSASTSASSASTSASSASTSASNASTSATAAASSATSAAANSVLSKYTFSTTTTMADPGVGVVRFNNATLSSVTSIAIDSQTTDTGNPNIHNWLVTLANSTSTVKATIQFSKAGAPNNFVIFQLTGLTNGSTWVQLNVTHVASAGSFASSDTLVMNFSRTGDAGTGDVTTTATQELTNKTLTTAILKNGYTETVYNLTGTVIAATNGTIQYITLTGNTTFTETIADGQSVTLMINPATYTVTWPTATWIGSSASAAPTLVASVYNCIVFFQFGGTLYAKYEGRV